MNKKLSLILSSVLVVVIILLVLVIIYWQHKSLQDYQTNLENQVEKLFEQNQETLDSEKEQEVITKTVIEKTIISDTLFPTISDITPVTGSFYYEGRAVVDLQFTTEPGAEVRVYRDSKGALAKYDEARISGADGKVRFDGIDLEGIHFGPFTVSAEWPSIREVSSQTGTASLSYQAQQQSQTSERVVRMIIAVRDLAGHVTTQEIRYTIGTCWSGELDFTVLPLLEYQTPTLLSPERLEEGSELISFVLSINYSGQSAHL